MQIKSILDKEFIRYGKVLTGYDTTPLLDKLVEKTEKPSDSVIYVPSDTDLESISGNDFSLNAYGGMPIQIGYCNGFNTKLNCLEYHRGSEVNIPADDVVLLLAPLQSVNGGKINSSEVEAFFVPKGTAVMIYETTLHYAPCNAVSDGKLMNDGFRVIIILPKGTNMPKKNIDVKDEEDKLLFANNKWLIAHPETSEAKQGAFVGIDGDNIDLLK